MSRNRDDWSLVRFGDVAREVRETETNPLDKVLSDASASNISTRSRCILNLEVSTIMKYPMTEEAKQAASHLVNAWSSGELEQRFWIRMIRDRDKANYSIYEGGRKDFPLPKPASLLELAAFDLVNTQREITQHSSEIWEILLMQELRNAVENDFEVSEYFLTMNAVGTIVQGDLNLQPGAVMQSAASNYGSIQQSNEQLADALTAKLGPQFVQSQDELRQAIEQLRIAVEAEKSPKLGKVMQELGRCIHLGASAAQLLPAIYLLTQALT